MTHTGPVHDDELNGAVARLLADYRPLPDIYDEMMDRRGGVRSHWRPFLQRLASLGPDEIERRFAIADRYLRDSGVFHRVYEDPTGVERAWPSSHVPLMIEPTDWEALKAGLVQRARLLEAVLADAYGAANLVRRGRLPAMLIAGNPEFVRPVAELRRAATRICGITPLMSGAAVTDGGGCLATGPRRRPVPAMPWKTASLLPARYPTSIAPYMFTDWPRSSAICRESCGD